jgi:hypothetical protein
MAGMSLRPRRDRMTGRLVRFERVVIAIDCLNYSQSYNIFHLWYLLSDLKFPDHAVIGQWG